MCGIAGAVALNDGLAPVSMEALARMAGALRHRGPDEMGVYRDARAGLAHARLSIIDLSTGQQPLCNADGTRWIVFNGEIFNYLELRADLEALGHTFRTRSDTEVLLHAWEAWGDDAFRRMNGQWAIAIWDERSRTLVLSRDPLGVRPLYWCEHGGRVWFASEVKAIFAGEPSMPRAFDPQGLSQVFTFWSSVAPRTVFAGVRELEPGHVCTWANGRADDRAFWAPSYPAGANGRFRGSFADAAAASREALENATSLRMLRADVPVGSYLSGGIDSSLVAALGLRAKGEKFNTFSLRFADAEYDETAFQRLMVERLGSDHHEVVVSRQDIARAFPDVVLHAERPLLRTAPAPMFLLSRLVRDAGIKVVLTEEGADEMFAGYDVFREARVRRFWARQPQSTARPRLLERLYPYLARSPVSQAAMARQFFGQDLAGWREPGFGHGPRWRSAGALQRLMSADVRGAAAGFDPVTAFMATLPGEFADWTHLAQDQYVEVRTLLSAYLLSSQGDRMLMANSVEGRFPFLDRDVVALANSLPDRFKLAGLDEKAVLKELSRDLVPDGILNRKKQPYRAPDALSFVGPDAPEWIGACMTESALAAGGVFDPLLASRFWRKCTDRREEGQFSNADNMALVGILSTQLLHHAFVARPFAVDRPATFDTLIDRIEKACRVKPNYPATGVPAGAPLLQDYLSASAARVPGQVALVCDGQRLTYAELESRSNALAHALVRRGVVRGDRVVVFADNTVQTVVSFWAILKANAVVCVINSQTRSDKLAAMLADCRASALISDARHALTFVDAAARSPHLNAVVVSGELAADRSALLRGYVSWDEAMAGVPGDSAPVRLNVDQDLAAIIYSSASTGDPKAIMLTHRNMLAVSASIVAYMENRPEDVLLSVLPLSLSYGTYQMVAAFAVGARLVLERSFVFPAQVLRAMVNEGVTGFAGVPMIWAVIIGLKNLGEYDLSRLRYVSNAAAALPVPHLLRLHELLPHVRIYSMYGQTECARISYLPPEDVDRKPGSIGIPIPNTEFWVVDEHGQRLGPNQVGELVVRGAHVMRGYWERPELTAARLRPGPLPGEVVLYTGDFHRIDDEGYLYFVSRMDDIIKTRGEKVSPREVENALAAIPGVHEVAVIGVPDELLGQAVKAFLLLEPGASLTEKAVRLECEKRVESFMVPKHVVFVTSLPRTSGGKIKKSELK